MDRSHERQRGQNTIELVFLIAVIAVAVIGLQTVLKRAVAGRLRGSMDQLSRQHFDPDDSYNFTDRSTGGADTTTTTNTGSTTTATSAATAHTQAGTIGSIAETTDATLP